MLIILVLLSIFFIATIGFFPAAVLLGTGFVLSRQWGSLKETFAKMKGGQNGNTNQVGNSQAARLY